MLYEVITIRRDGRIEEIVKARYATFDIGIGATVESGEASFESLAAYALKNGELV